MHAASTVAPWSDGCSVQLRSASTRTDGPLTRMHLTQMRPIRRLCPALAVAAQIKKILGGLPPTTARQTYLFSATFPVDVQQLVNLALKPKHRYNRPGARGRPGGTGG